MRECSSYSSPPLGGERLSWSSSVLPRASVPKNGIEDGQELSHASGQGELGRLASGAQAGIEAGDDGIVPTGHQGRHVQGGAHACPTAEDGAPAAQGPAIAIERCQTGQGGNGFAAQSAEFGQVGDQ